MADVEFLFALKGTLDEDQSPDLALSLRQASGTYSRDETDQAISDAVADKADLESPEFTGVPTAPTADPGTDTGQIATTEFVQAAIDALPSAGDVFGPSSSVDGRIAVFDGTTGKVVKDVGVAISGLATAAQGARADTAVQPLDIADMLTTSDVGLVVQPYDVNTAKTNVAQQFSKPQRASITALTSGTTITPNLADSNDFSLTLGHNATLANPTNQSSYVGLKGSIACVQDGTGGRTLAFGANWFPIGAATAPAAPAGANAKFRIDFHVVSSTRIDFKLSSVGV